MLMYVKAALLTGGAVAGVVVTIGTALSAGIWILMGRRSEYVVVPCGPCKGSGVTWQLDQAEICRFCDGNASIIRLAD